MSHIEIFTDYDGTITETDTLEFLLDRFADPSWVEIENLVREGKLAEVEALQAEFDMLDISKEEVLEAILNEITVDPSFKDFIDRAAGKGMNITILSGGIKEFITEKLKREGITGIKILANELHIEDGRWTIRKPPSARLCGLCNHCKTHTLINSVDSGKIVVYIGDGTTDRCPAYFADILFAKGDLAEFCDSNGIEYTGFRDFRDVLEELEKMDIEGPAGGRNPAKRRKRRFPPSILEID